MHVEQQAPGGGGADGLRYILIGLQRVPHVDGHAHVGQRAFPGVGDGRPHIGNKAVVAGFLGLVFQAEADVGSRQRAFPQPFHQPLGGVGVIGLEGIIIAVLAVPDADGIAADKPGGLHHVHGFLHRRLAHVRIGMGKGAQTPDGPAEMIRNDGHGGELIFFQLFLHHLPIVQRQLPAPDKFHRVDVINGGQPLEQLLNGERFGIAAGHIPVGAGTHVPENHGVLHGNFSFLFIIPSGSKALPAYRCTGS